MVMKKLGRRESIIVGAFLALLVGLFALATAAPASAQDLPAICDEYPELPECEVRPDPPDPDPDPPEGPTADDGDGDGDGELPFTGYPLTGLILLFLILLAIGLAIRAGTAIRERIARGPSNP